MNMIELTDNKTSKKRALKKAPYRATTQNSHATT